MNPPRRRRAPPGLVVALGAGCTALVRWRGITCQIEIRTSRGQVSRKVDVEWTRAVLSSADAEVRHIASRALRLGAPRPEAT